MLVSPRLSGDDHLGPYVDWLNWTQRRVDDGLTLTFECGGNTLDVDVDTERSATRPLGRAVQLGTRWSTRTSSTTTPTGSSPATAYVPRSACSRRPTRASALEFALPTVDGDPRERVARRRSRFASFVNGFALDWSDEKGSRLLAEQRQRAVRLRGQLGALTRTSGAALDARCSTTAG